MRFSIVYILILKQQKKKQLKMHKNKELGKKIILHYWRDLCGH